MKHFVCAFLAIILFSINSIAQKMEDVVYLKNGSIIHGTVIEQVPGKSIKIQNTIGDVYFFDIADVEKITKEPLKGYSANNSNSDGKLYPGLSCLFSFIVPGAGQMYNGEYTKGAIMMVADVGLLIGTFYYANHLVISDTEYDTYDGYFYNAGTLHDNHNIYYCLIALDVADELWSVIDAPLSAKRINQKNGLSLNYHINKNMDIALSPDYKFDMSLNRLAPVYGAKISLNFK